MVREGEDTASLPVSQNKSKTIPSVCPQGNPDQRKVFRGVGCVGGYVHVHFTVFCSMYPALSVRALKLIPLCSAGDRDGSAKGAAAALSRTSLSSSHGQEEGVSNKCYEIAGTEMRFTKQPSAGKIFEL